MAEVLDDLATAILNRFKSAPDAETITIDLAPEDVRPRSAVWGFAYGHHLQAAIRRELRTRRAVKDVVVCFPNGEQPMRISRSGRRAAGPRATRSARPA